MNRVQIRGLFWELLGLPSTYSRAPGSGSPAGPTTDLLIEQGIQTMVRRAKPVHCRAQGSISITAGTASPYALPSNFFEYLDSEEPLTISGYALNHVLRGITTQMAAGIAPTQETPIYWYDMGVETASPFARQIGFYPTPNAAMTAVVPYLRLPISLTGTGMTDGTEYPDLPADFHDAPAFFAAWRFYQGKQEDNPKQEEYLRYFVAQTERLIEATREQIQITFRRCTPDVISRSMDDWIPV